MEMEKKSLKDIKLILKNKDPDATTWNKNFEEEHLGSLKDYSSLKRLEKQLTGTVDKQVGSLGLKEITAGAVAGSQLGNLALQAGQRGAAQTIART